MNNNDEIEILDDFDFEDNSKVESSNITNNDNFNDKNENNVFNFEIESNKEEDMPSLMSNNENSIANENELNTFEFETDDIKEENKNISEPAENILPTLEENEFLPENNTPTIETVKADDKEELENPVTEMINNKTTMRLIVILLIVLFIAIVLMPKFFELINA